MILPRRSAVRKIATEPGASTILRSAPCDGDRVDAIMAVVSRRGLAVAILIALGVAALTFVQAQRVRFMALLSTPAAGAYGTSWADLPPPDIRAEGHAKARALHNEADWTERVSFACAALSLAGILVAAWLNRRDVRSWHWLSFLGLGLLATTAVMSLVMSLNHPRKVRLTVLVALALVASLLDLRRGKYGAPGRPAAWVTLLLSLLFGFVLLSDA